MEEFCVYHIDRRSYPYIAISGNVQPNPWWNLISTHNTWEEANAVATALNELTQ